MPKAPPTRPPLPKPIIAMIIAASALFVTPVIWLAGLTQELALLWAFVWFDVILVASIMLFRRRRNVE